MSNEQVCNITVVNPVTWSRYYDAYSIEYLLLDKNKATTYNCKYL